MRKSGRTCFNSIIIALRGPAKAEAVSKINVQPVLVSYNNMIVAMVL